MNAQGMWRCEECTTLHDHVEDAENCCQPVVTKRWICRACEEEHDSKHEAESCCEEAQDSPPTAAELEAAGQERLPI